MNVTVIVRFLTNCAETTRAALRIAVRFIVLFYEKREELIILLFLAIMVWLAALLYGLDANAQSKFFSTPNRGGAEGAKGNAMLHTLLQENVERRNETTANAASITALRDATEASLTTITNCGAQGMIFGRGHATANSNDCIPSLQVANDGRVSLQGGMKFGDYALCDPTTAGTLRYNAAAKRMEFCNGSIWGMLGGNMGCSINFPAMTNADLDTYYDTTDAIYSAETATASVAGATPATIRRNGANTGMSSGVIFNQGNSVGIRGRSASLFNQTANFTLDIGAYTACWQITTKQQDVTPNSFTFTDLTGQELSTLLSSNSVTVSGFDGPLTVSVSGQGNPQLKIGGGSWTTSGEINPGQSLTLRLTTSPDYETQYLATVALGTSSVQWHVTTKSQCTTTTQAWSAAGQYSVVVPPGCTSMAAKLWGAGGGGGQHSNQSGGGGAFVTSTLAVTPGETITVRVGAGGAPYAGGGLTAIVRSGTPLAAAGAGGGAGQGNTDCGCACGCGGPGGAGGPGGLNGGTGGTGAGCGGEAGSPGAGGAGATLSSGSSFFGNGLSGGSKAGGGGGGYYVGWTGQIAQTCEGGGGGGGGSSLGASITSGTGRVPGGTGDPNYQSPAGYGAQGTASNGGNGRVVVTWSTP
jgi:hypothetical protein